MPSVRQAALEVLLAVESQHTTLAAEVERGRRRLADPRDRALLLELANGTLRWQARLDALLQQCSDRPLIDLHPAVRGTLRLAAYQLEHLDRIPAHAALNEAVELARLKDQQRATGFVNGVLRTFVRRRGDLDLPQRPDDPTDRTAALRYLAISLSHPDWLAGRWLDRYGFEAAERWCQFNNRPPAVTIRPRDPAQRDALLRALHAAEADASPARFVRDAFELSPGALGALPTSLRDQMAIQEEASQIVACAVLPEPGDRVLDLCAAPGGKTMVLAAVRGGSGLLVASDFRPSRVRLLASMLRSTSVESSIVRLDATRPLPFFEAFDRVLVDAPCSGLGTVRLNPDLKWSRQPADLARFAASQQVMLAHASAAVRPGGRLVYATCSSEPEENDQVVDAFLAAHPHYRLHAAAFGDTVTDAGALVDPRGLLRTLPPRDGLDAFFAAVLVRDQTA